MCIGHIFFSLLYTVSPTCLSMNKFIVFHLRQIFTSCQQLQWDQVLVPMVRGRKDSSILGTESNHPTAKWTKHKKPG